MQALVTLNDPVYIEIANAFADRMKQKNPDSVRDQIAYGIFLATGNRQETAVEALFDLYQEADQEYQRPTVKLISSEGDNEEIAFSDPLAIIANAILNLDQVLTKE